MQCVGFIVTLQRGAEWAVTGNVTQPVPYDFPSVAGIVLRPDFKELTLEDSDGTPRPSTGASHETHSASDHHLSRPGRHRPTPPLRTAGPRCPSAMRFSYPSQVN